MGNGYALSGRDGHRIRKVIGKSDWEVCLVTDEAQQKQLFQGNTSKGMDPGEQVNRDQIDGNRSEGRVYGN